MVHFVQLGDLSLSSFLGSGRTFVVFAAPLTSADYPQYHRNSSMRKSCTSAEAVEAALHASRNGEPLAEEQKMANYKQFRSLNSAFSRDTNIISDRRES